MQHKYEKIDAKSHAKICIRFGSDFGLILGPFWVDFGAKSVKNRKQIEADGVENSKMAARGLKEALRTHFEASWEASRGHEQFFGYLIGAPAPPRKEINLHIIDIRW